MELSLFFSYVFTLAMITNPLGNIPMFLSAIKQVPDRRKTFVIIREVLIAICIMMFFLLFGKFFLQALDLDISSMAIGGGIIVFVIGVQMIFPARHTAKSGGDETEPFIVPLAIPLVAGPSTLTTVMLFSARGEGNLLEWAGIIAAVGIVNAVVLAGFSVKLSKLLGMRGLMAVEKLTGMLLVTISVQMIVNAVLKILGR